MLLKEKIAIVTGGSGTIGTAISCRLAAEGTSILIHYFRRKREAEQLVQKIEMRGGKAFAFQADIRDSKQVEEMIQKVVCKYGTVDILVNNASTNPTEIGLKSFLDHTWDDYQKYIDTVLKGTFHCCRNVLPLMIKKKSGRIINIGTTSLNEINASLNPYVTAKGGLLGMTRSLAEEFGKYNITVNQVVPGWVWSDLKQQPDKNNKCVFQQRSPLGVGVVFPEDVANAVIFLASDLARMITGVYLPVCAGQVMPS